MHEGQPAPLGVDALARGRNAACAARAALRVLRRRYLQGPERRPGRAQRRRGARLRRHPRQRHAAVELGRAADAGDPRRRARRDQRDTGAAIASVVGDALVVQAAAPRHEAFSGEDEELPWLAPMPEQEAFEPLPELEGFEEVVVPAASR